MPDCFKLDDGQAETGKTTVMGNGGPNGTVPKPPELDNGAHRRNLGVTFGQIADGTSNTVLLINAPDSMAVDWTKPDEFAPTEAEMKLILSRQFTSQFADGSSQTIKKGLSIETFKAILTRAGGEIIQHSELVPQR